MLQEIHVPVWHLFSRKFIAKILLYSQFIWNLFSVFQILNNNPPHAIYNITSKKNKRVKIHVFYMLQFLCVYSTKQKVLKYHILKPSESDSI